MQLPPEMIQLILYWCPVQDRLTTRLVCRELQAFTMLDWLRAYKAVQRWIRYVARRRGSMPTHSLIETELQPSSSRTGATHATDTGTVVTNYGQKYLHWSRDELLTRPVRELPGGDGLGWMPMRNVQMASNGTYVCQIERLASILARVRVVVKGLVKIVVGLYGVTATTLLCERYCQTTHVRDVVIDMPMCILLQPCRWTGIFVSITTHPTALAPTVSVYAQYGVVEDEVQLELCTRPVEQRLRGGRRLVYRDNDLFIE